ncbi:MAG: hypothetical protein ACQEQL_05325 [Pseudomonadota bacterium]
MVDYMNDPLPELLRDVADDGVVDAEELQAIQNRLLEDDEISQDEAEFLFAINDYVGENSGNIAEYEEFFIEAIICFVLNDPLSPGVLDEDEWFWLKAMVAEDGELGDIESKLLVELADRAASLPADFEDFAKEFEEVEYEDELAQNTFLYARIQGAISNKIRDKIEK